MEIQVLIGVPGAVTMLDMINTRAAIAAIAAKRDLEQWVATRPAWVKN